MATTTMRHVLFQALALLGLLLGMAGTSQAQTVVYYHTDALGSPVAVTDASGMVLERREYEPYGKQLTPALQDGPGYTGHVSDAATGLNYMQQRYYDSQCGCFLSVDPVTAYEKPLTNFNRYWYANANPYKFTDPDGRDIRIQVGGDVTLHQAQGLLVGMLISRAGESEVRQLDQSKEMYIIRVDSRAENWYDADTRTVYINPESSTTIKSSGEKINPILTTAHEVSHAAQHDRVGTEKFQKALIRQIDQNGKQGVSPEETRATEVEKQVGKDLDMPVRRDYLDVER